MTETLQLPITRRAYASATARRIANRTAAKRKDPEALIYLDAGNTCRNGHSDPMRYCSNDTCFECVREKNTVWRAHLEKTEKLGEAEAGL